MLQRLILAVDGVVLSSDRQKFGVVPGR